MNPVHIKDRKNPLVIEKGDYTLHCYDNTVEVFGKVTFIVHGDVDQVIEGDLNQHVKGSINITADKNMKLKAERIDLN